MKKNILAGLIAGLLAGGINLLPLLLAPGLAATVYLSTLVTWVVAGFFVATSALPWPGALKGAVVALLVGLPSLFFTAASSPAGAAWSALWAVMTGALLGFVLQKVQSRGEKGQD